MTTAREETASSVILPVGVYYSRLKAMAVKGVVHQSYVDRMPSMWCPSHGPRRLSTVWVEKIPDPWFFWRFYPNGWEFLVQIIHAYCTFSSTSDCKILFSYLQLWRSYAILSAAAIICSKRPPSVEAHAGWSHLIWHNFVIVGDNWIKICILAWIATYIREVKFGSKIPNCLGKMSENASLRFGR